MKTMKQLLNVVIIILVSAFFFGCDKEVYDMDEPGNLVPKTVTDDLLLPRLEINGKLFHAETMGNIEDDLFMLVDAVNDRLKDCP